MSKKSLKDEEIDPKKSLKFIQLQEEHQTDENMTENPKISKNLLETAKENPIDNAQSSPKNNTQMENSQNSPKINSQMEQSKRSEEEKEKENKNKPSGHFYLDILEAEAQQHSDSQENISHVED